MEAINRSVARKYLMFMILLLWTGIGNNAAAQAIDQGKPNYENLLSKGKILENKEKYDSAIIFLNKAILANPKGDEALYHRASCYFWKRQYQDAISDISKAIAISPKDPLYYLDRAMYHNSTGEYDKGLADCNSALSFASKKWTRSWPIFSVRGTSLMRTGHYEEAVNDFTQHINIKQRDTFAWPHLDRGYCLYKLKKCTDAIKDFEFVLNLDPTSIEALFFQGVCFLETGEINKAKENALKIEDINPSKLIYFSGEHLLDLYDSEKRNLLSRHALSEAIEYKNQQQFDQAFKKLEYAWLYSSRFGHEGISLQDSIWKNMVELYTKMNSKPTINELARKFVVQAAEKTESKKYDAAISLLEKVKMISPFYPPAYFNLALLYGQLNKYSQAIKNMKTYLLLAPDASDARAAQDKIYEWEGKSEN